MEQYLELKRGHQDEVLFFRLGDFYEMFMDDAKEVSRLLNLTLTARNGVPMCGIPYHAARNYIKRLLDEGKKIAVCEQVEMSDSTRSLARREVVQIITPGTVVDDEFLDASSNNHIVCVCLAGNMISCAYSELSGGLFRMVMLPVENRWESLRSLLEELMPREILVNEDDYFTNRSFAEIIDRHDAMKTRLPSWYFSISHGFSVLREHAATVGLKQFGIEPDDPVLLSGGALLRYIRETSNASLGHITEFTKVQREKRLLIDESTRKNLELLTNLQDGSAARTLFSSVNATCTSGGARLLKQWISSPLADLAEIEQRQREVAWFFEHAAERRRVRLLLNDTRDLSRLTSRVAMHRAIPHDLVAIRQSIASFFTLTGEYAEHYRVLLGPSLHDDAMTELVSLMEILLSSLQENCQGPFLAGQVIKAGYSPELDSIRGMKAHGGNRLSDYVAKLKEETGIPTIRLAQNRIIGHYLEIPKTHSRKIPDSFLRKQTLVNAERYTTEELISYETEILESEEKAERLEKELFEELLNLAARQIPRLLALGAFFSFLDCLQSFAHIAQQHGYCRPDVVPDDVLCIEEGRHPVVEQQLPQGGFVANPLEMGEGKDRFCLITGPNMAGKSTYLRQNALIVLLAQTGSFVPAKRARIGLTDKLYCRVGASDNLARGESTFLIEMQEAAFILNTATERSFVIMDEIGRGTSTQDGMSIAFAMMRRLVAMGTKTLFATHYHELTMLDTSGMQLLTLEVAQTRRGIVFLRKIKNGAADSSYGLHVARMAGVPNDVVKDAAQFQRQHFADYALAGNTMQLDLFTGSSEGLDAGARDDFAESVFEEIMNYPLDDSTPMETMRFLESIRKRISTR